MSKNKNTALAVTAIVIGMFLLAFASVPLYNIFCKVTGYGGTTQVSKTLPNKVGNKTFTIYFNADISPKLNWEFKPEQRKISTKPGKSNLIFYTSENKENFITTGIASYNVTPDAAGKYFSKIECFCFTNQSLEPLQKVHMPVSFFIDPEIENDPLLHNVSEITLSYSFFEAK